MHIMIINRVIDGQYSEAKFEDGTKVFFSVLPDRITVSKMWWAFPTKKLWEFVFPFYIRTSNEAWDSSKEILRLTIEAVKEASTMDDLIKRLENNASKALREYVKEHGESARDISVDKVGLHAFKQMLNPKELVEIEKIVTEYGKVQVEVCEQMLEKYPTMHFPESLLPYPKKKIEWALENAIQYTDDEKMVENLKSCLAILQTSFVADELANEKNKPLLENEDWQIAVKKKKLLSPTDI